MLLLLPLSCLSKQTTTAGALSKCASTATTYENVVWQRRVYLVNTEAEALIGARLAREKGKDEALFIVGMASDNLMCTTGN